MLRKKSFENTNSPQKKRNLRPNHFSASMNGKKQAMASLYKMTDGEPTSTTIKDMTKKRDRKSK